MKTKTNEEPPDVSAFQAILFDLRIPGIDERVHRARAIYQEESDIEFLDENHAVLLLKRGKVGRGA